jgi:uncharacterized membrane-anchored protein
LNREQTSAYNALSPIYRQFLDALLNDVGSRFNVSSAYLQTIGASAKGNARRSIHRKAAKILQEVQPALEEQLEARIGLTPAFVKMRIGTIAQGVDLADIEPYINGSTNEETGKPWTLNDLRDAGVNTAALRKIKPTKDGVEVEVADPMPALREIARVLGMGADVTMDINVRAMVFGDLTGLSDEALRMLHHAARKTDDDGNGNGGGRAVIGVPADKIGSGDPGDSLGDGDTESD